MAPDLDRWRARVVPTAVVRVVAAAGALAMSAALGGRYGPDAVGDFLFAYGLLSVAVVVVRWGADYSLVEAVRGAAQPSAESARALRAALSTALGAGVPIAVAAALLSGPVSVWIDAPDARLSLIAAGVAVPLFGVAAVLGSNLKGRGRPAAAAAVERGVAFVPAALVVWLLGSTELRVDEVTAVGILVAATVAGAAGVLMNLRWVASAVRATGGEERRFGRTRRDFGIAEVSGVVEQLGVTVLGGIMLTSSEFGALKLAERFGMLLNLPGQVVGSTQAPVIAEVHHRGPSGRAGIRRLVASGTRTLYWTTLPIGIAFIVFSSELFMLFGGDYPVARYLLVVFVLAQLVRQVGTLPALVLGLTGHARTVRNVALGAGAASVTLFPILTWALGVRGAPLGTALAMVVQTVLLLSAYRIALESVAEVDAA